METFLTWKVDGSNGGNYRQNRDTLRRLEDDRYLDGYGYKVYSQNDEDGILQEIFSRIGTDSKRFVEFGVQNGLECNSHYLLLRGWQGLWLEGSESDYWEIRWRFAPALADGRLRVKQAFIDKENIVGLLADAGRRIDLLSIDIDGNDYVVLEAILKGGVITPRVIVAEYNGKWPADFRWVMPYDPLHTWDGSDYYGASLLSFTEMLQRYGYSLVGTNTCGANAFFVKNDALGDHFPYPLTVENLYNAKRGIIHRKGHAAKRFCDVKPVTKKQLDIRSWNQATFDAYDKVFIRGGGAFGRFIASFLPEKKIVFVDDAMLPIHGTRRMTVQEFQEYVEAHPSEKTVCILGSTKYFWPMAIQMTEAFPQTTCYEPRELLLHHMMMEETEKNRRLQQFYRELDRMIASEKWFTLQA